MRLPLATLIRHPDENLAKCTLEPLRQRPEFSFLEFSHLLKVDATDMIVLMVGSPEISTQDIGRSLILLDGNWKHVPKLKSSLVGNPLYRSLPPIATAYPRKNNEGQDPVEGLASIEALYLALKLMGHDDPTILDNYYWREDFLKSVARLQL